MGPGSEAISLFSSPATAPWLFIYGVKTTPKLAFRLIKFDSCRHFGMENIPGRVNVVGAISAGDKISADQHDFDECSAR
jgi:hypothetical protein